MRDICSNPRAVDLASLDELVGYLGVVVAEDEGGDGNPEHHVDEDQAPQAAVEVHRLKHANQGNKDALVGDEHPEGMSGKTTLAPRNFHLAST